MATINYASGNINVSFFPTNINPVWFCDKNTGGINLATNGAAIAANTIQLGNVNTTTNVSGTLKTNLITSAASTLNLGGDQTSALSIGDKNVSGINIGTGGGFLTNTIQIGNVNTTTNVSGALKTGPITINQPLTIGYTPSAITSNTMVGYSYKYTITGCYGVTLATLANFSNSPIGIYLLTIGPVIVFDFTAAGNERADIVFASTTGIESFTTFGNLENSGTAAEKFGICMSMLIRITSATNQLTVQLSAVVGGFSMLGGASAITRIA